MDPQDWLNRCARQLAQREQLLLLRRRQITRPIDATHIEIAGRTYVNFSSNNYLGLTHHPRMLEAVRSVEQSGSGAAGLITGHTELHAQAEAAIAQWKGMESAVLLPSGYQANVAAIQTLAGIAESYSGGVRFLVDKLAHASLIDAIRSSDAEMRVFPHNGMAKLRRLLDEADADQLQVVVTESIFSMDGDSADLAQIAKMKSERPFVLLVDEAHASGVYGPAGAGLAAELGLAKVVDVSVVTLSKAIGAAGGAVCGSRVFTDALLNFGRAFIYSTNVSPAITACSMAAIQIMKREPERQSRVRKLAAHARGALQRAGFDLPVGDSPIIPVVLGSEEAVLSASQRLAGEGMWITAVRPPTVAPGASRLRITLSCAHTDQEVEKLLQQVSRITN